MATPIAHALLGLASGQFRRSDSMRALIAWYLWLVVSANAADLDFVPGLLIGDMNRWHHQGSHSLLAVLLWGVFSWFIARWATDRRLTWAAGSALAYATHLLADWLTADNRAPHGIPLLWPLDIYSISPVSVFGGVRHGVPGDSTMDTLGQIFSAHNLGVIGWELLITVPVFIVVAIIARRRI